MKDQDERQIRYKVLTLDLAIARTDEKYELAGYNLAVLFKSVGATATLKFNQTTAEEIDLANTKHIESKFSRFFITNTAQTGLTMVLVIGEENFKVITSDDVRGIVDDTVKGLMRSIGDVGANPNNTTGSTVLQWLYGIFYRNDTMAANTVFSLLTTTALGASASFTSGSDDLNYRGHRTVVAHAFADQAGTLYIEQSPNGTNWDLVENVALSANVGVALVTVVESRYIRFRYVNGATAQTIFRLAKRYDFA